jgi:hypothetical protein
MAHHAHQGHHTLPKHARWVRGGYILANVVLMHHCCCVQPVTSRPRPCQFHRDGESDFAQEHAPCIHSRNIALDCCNLPLNRKMGTPSLAHPHSPAGMVTKSPLKPDHHPKIHFGQPCQMSLGQACRLFCAAKNVASLQSLLEFSKQHACSRVLRVRMCVPSGAHACDGDKRTSGFQCGDMHDIACMHASVGLG